MTCLQNVIMKHTVKTKKLNIVLERASVCLNLIVMTEKKSMQSIAVWCSNLAFDWVDWMRYF